MKIHGFFFQSLCLVFYTYKRHSVTDTQRSIKLASSFHFFRKKYNVEQKKLTYFSLIEYYYLFDPHLLGDKEF